MFQADDMLPLIDGPKPEQVYLAEQPDYGDMSGISFLKEEDMHQLLAASTEAMVGQDSVFGCRASVYWETHFAVRYKDEHKVTMNGVTKNKQRIRKDHAAAGIVIDAVGYTMLSAFVQRVRKENCTKSCNAFRVVCNPSSISAGENRIAVDLNSVYEVNNEVVYELPTAHVGSSNNFRIVVFLFNPECNIWLMMEVPQHFKIVGKEKKEGRSNSKRKHVDSTYASPEPPFFKNRSFEESGYAEDSVSPASTSSINALCVDSLDAKSVQANEIVAKLAKLGVLKVCQTETTNGDIAYHVKVHHSDRYVVFMEGQIVAVIYDENDKTVLKHVSRDNIKTSLCKGIISRSQYLSAHCPQNSSDVTETICFMGLVPVLVRGPVQFQDRIFPSLDCQGTAISERSYRYNADVYQNIGWIGTAWETVEADDNDVTLVECFVQLGNQFIGNRLTEQMSSLTDSIKRMSESKKKTSRRCVVAIAAACIILSLVVCLLWQVMMPGSAYHMWRCQHGCISGHTASFRYIPTSSIYMYRRTRGDEFTFEGLQSKIKEDLNPMKDPGARYFLNRHRCSYISFPLSDSEQDKRANLGPIVFAVNADCTKVFYYYDVISKWTKYISAEELTCYPPSTRGRHH